MKTVFWFIRVRAIKAMLKLSLAPEEIYRDSANPVFSDVRDGVRHLQAGSYQVRYQLTNSRRQVYSIYTLVRKLLQRRDIVEVLGEVTDLKHIPNPYLGLSLQDMAAHFVTQQ